MFLTGNHIYKNCIPIKFNECLSGSWHREKNTIFTSNLLRLWTVTRYYRLKILWYGLKIYKICWWTIFCTNNLWQLYFFILYNIKYPFVLICVVCMYFNSIFHIRKAVLNMIEIICMNNIEKYFIHNHILIIISTDESCIDKLV